MNAKEKIRNLLYASFDRELDEDERRILEKALQDPELRAEADELKNMRRLLADTSWEFGEDFTARVTQRIAQEEKGKVVEMEPERQFLSVFRKMAIAGVAAVFLLLLSIYFTSGSLSKETIFGTENFSEDELVSYLLYEDFNE